ncbi:phage tail assembly chaperone [Pseudomonas sp. ANT_J12]|uniref:phage tail assembly chaperone n=1 Tax=Pseudomonas sp. ANT_J12 TaxID=2597351 RepID=UPI002114F25C|nr:phage tail assembly chaperone [Pseudomonas sp. ANT_J12]
MDYLKSAVGAAGVKEQSADDISWNTGVADEVINKDQVENNLRDAARKWRNEQLMASQWLLDRDRDEIAAGIPLTLTTEDFYELIEYRQELRDWPQRPGFPKKTTKPLAPDWLMRMLQGV